MSKLSKQERLARLQNNLQKQKFKWSDLDNEFSYRISLVEMHYGVFVDKNYPLMKLIEQELGLMRFKQEEAKANGG